MHQGKKIDGVYTLPQGYVLKCDAQTAKAEPLRLHCSLQGQPQGLSGEMLKAELEGYYGMTQVQLESLVDWMQAARMRKGQEFQSRKLLCHCGEHAFCIWHGGQSAT